MSEYNKPGAGIKHDEGKSQWNLLPLQYLDGVVRVLMRGAAKYSAHNWRAGMPWSQTYNATQRHLNAFMAGENLDPESGQHHLDHALCELIFLRAHVQDYAQHDDRYKAAPMTATEVKARWESPMLKDGNTFLGGNWFDNHKWHEWAGGECPVKKGDRIVVRFRDYHNSAKDYTSVDAPGMYWDHRGLAGDIIAWKYL